MSNFPPMLMCVDCRRPLLEDTTLCSNCGRVYEVKNNILIAWPKEMDKLAEEEAEHHDHDDSDATEVHQLNRPRNFFYHELLWKTMKKLTPGGEILEIGAGSGFDARELVADYSLTLSDVSPGTLARLAGRLKDWKIGYIAADGSKLPFTDGSFAGLYMVATLHHLPDAKAGVSEFARVLKSGGQLVIAIEPNATYFRWIKQLRGLLCKLTHMKPEEGSHADAEMEGFSYHDLVGLFPQEIWKNVEIRPVWFLAGLWHYGAEFFFRSLRLKKRLVLPSALEWFLVYADEALFKIPGIKYLAWHWYISAQKV